MMHQLLCLFLLSSAVQAASQSIPPTIQTPNKGLSSEQLQAIRQLGQSLLQAKKEAREEQPVNKNQIVQLNSALNDLITAETPALSVLSPPVVMNPSGNSSVTPLTQPSPAKNRVSRNAAQTQAWDIVHALRQNASHVQRLKNSPAKVQVYSGGFPVGEQHGRLYDHWADQLDTILTHDSSDRLAQLHALKAQLVIQKTGDFRTPIAERTPTIQAMPWQTAKAVRKNKPPKKH